MFMCSDMNKDERTLQLEPLDLAIFEDRVAVTFQLYVLI